MVYVFDNIQKQPKYVALKTLTTFDYIGYPIPVVDDEVECDEDMCLYSGILLGNGYIENNYQYVSFYRDKGADMCKALIDFLNKHKIDTRLSFPPVHIQPYYVKKFKFKRNQFLNAINSYDSFIDIPIWYGMKKKTQNYIIKKINEFFKK